MDDELLVLGVPMKQKLASSREQLAELLGVSVRCIADHLSRGKSPGKKQNGSYDVQAWRDYFDSVAGNLVLGDGDDVAELRRRKLIASVELEEARAQNERLEALEREGVLVEIVKIKQIGTTAVAKLRDVLLRELLACSTDAKQYDALKLAVDRSFLTVKKDLEQITNEKE